MIPEQPYSPALSELYGRREYVRSMLDASAKSSLADNAATTKREVAAINPNKGGIYSSAVVGNSLRGAATASGARSRGYLENKIMQTRASSDADQTGDIASQHSHEEDRRQGYAYSLAAGNAAASAQKRAEAMQLVGMVGGGLLSFL